MHITTASYSMTLRAQCAQDIFFFDCGLRAWDVTGTEDTNDSASRSTLIPDVNGHNGRSLVILSGITSSVSTWFRIVILTGVSTLWLYSALPLMLDSRRERASPTRTSRHTPFTRADLGTLTRLVGFVVYTNRGIPAYCACSLPTGAQSIVITPLNRFHFQCTLHRRPRRPSLPSPKHTSKQCLLFGSPTRITHPDL